MKFTAAILGLAGLAAAVPTPTENRPLDARTIEKRASITDACDVGYCTQNGGYARLHARGWQGVLANMHVS